MEPILYGYMLGKAHTLGGIVHAIGGMEDHIHMIVSIPPNVLITDFVRRIKGSSSRYLSHYQAGTQSEFAWQRGYGVMSMGSKQMDAAVNYVVNQKTHHGQNVVNPVLEMEMHENDGPPAWGNGAAVAGASVISEQPSED